MKQSSAPLYRLFKLIGPYRWWVVAGVLLSFATVGSSVGLMAMSAYLISKAAIVTEVVELSMAIAFVRTFAIARAGFRYVERVVTHRATFRILTYLRVWFYRSIEPLAPARLQQYRSGDLLTRIVADIETLENFYVRVVVPPLAAALVTVLACAILGIFEFWLGVALFIFLALTGVGLPLLSSKLSRLPAADLTTVRAELNAALVDEIQGAADLIAFGQEANQTARIERLQRSLTQAQERLALGRGLCDGLAALFTSLAGLTILFLAIPLVSDGKLNGVFLALLPLTAIASFEAVQPLTLAFQNLEGSRAAAGRLFELIDTAPALNDPDHPSPQPADFSLEVRNLRFSYEPGEPPVLDGLSFCIPAGQCTALVGPSGAGKSSLVNLLQRFWDYQEGEIRLGGYELHEYQAEDVRRLLSVVSQQPHLFNSTLRDNLWLANPQASEEAMWSACRQAQLETFIQSLPQGLDTLIGENGLLLSGGERQRLAIARALLKDAPILILDESTANLDAVTEHAVVQALESFRVGRTTLIIAHAPGRLGHVDQVIALENGRVLA